MMSQFTKFIDFFILPSLAAQDNEKNIIQARTLVGINLMYFSSLFFLVLVIGSLLILDILVLWGRIAIP